jgi:DNA-binding transcriptional LysR family regulator
MTTNRIDAMALFVTAIDTGSLSAAARESGLSLSSVSRHLTMLEERIGTRLIIRSTRMLALTEVGAPTTRRQSVSSAKSTNWNAASPRLRRFLRES